MTPVTRVRKPGTGRCFRAPRLGTVCLTHTAGHIHVPLAACSHSHLLGWHRAHSQAGSSLPLGSGARELGLTAGIEQSTEGAWLRLCLTSLCAPAAQGPCILAAGWAARTRAALCASSSVSSSQQRGLRVYCGAGTVSTSTSRSFSQ